MMDYEKLLDKIPTKELYDDLFSPGLKKAGEALETVLDGANLILLPLKLLNKKSRVFFDDNMKRYAEKLDEQSNLTVSKVPQYVGLPIVDKLTYLNQEDLAEAFINLLTKASFEETINMVHPAYINTLNNLSADEAKILFHYKSTERIPFIDIYLHRYVEKVKRPEYFDDKGSKTREQLKTIFAYTEQNKEDVFIRSGWNLTDIQNDVELDFPENIDIYIENLTKNGIFEFERTTLRQEDVEKHKHLEKNTYAKIMEDLDCEMTAREEDEFEFKIDVRAGHIQFTEYGKGFLEASIENIDPANKK
jgi:hypothetical protein